MDNTDIKKLEALLAHWIEHTEEHSEEYAEWAQKMDFTEFAEVKKHLLLASKGMGSVQGSLEVALKELKKLGG